MKVGPFRKRKRVVCDPEKYQELKASFLLCWVSLLFGFQASCPSFCQGSFGNGIWPLPLFSQNYHGYNLQTPLTIRATKKGRIYCKHNEASNTQAWGHAEYQSWALRSTLEVLSVSFQTYPSQWHTPFVHRWVPVFLWAPCWGTWPARAPKNTTAAATKQWFVFLFLSSHSS